MQLTEPMVLPMDLLLLPVQDLPEKVRKQVDAEEGDYALTRPHSRTPSRIVDASAADLLKEFRSPITIVDAVIRYSREKNVDPEKTLEEALPMLERLAGSHLLVLSSSDEAKQILPSLEPSSRFMEFEVIRCIQSLEDTELYQVRGENGESVALKLSRANASATARATFDREAAILARIEGGSSPRLLRSDTSQSGQRYLVMDWCNGKDCASVAGPLRAQPGMDSRRKLLEMCSAILRAYVRLHERNVIHSDIHPRNVLVDEDGQVKIIDFGFARISGLEHEYRRAQRAGVAFFFEPEYARAIVRKATAPASSAHGEQYALAALLYSLITGHHYVDFSLEKAEIFRQIAEEEPVPFIRRGISAWPEMEEALAKALQKHAKDRFGSLAEFASAVEAISLTEESTEEEITAPAAYPDARNMLHAVLSRMDIGGDLFATGFEAAPRTSLTYGSAGIAYALYRMACCRDDSRLLAAADLWATRSSREVDHEDAFYSREIEINQETVGRVSPYHTASGVYAVQLLIARSQSDLLTQQMVLDRYLAAVQQYPCESLDVTLGRSGTLLGAAFLLNAIKGCKYLDPTALRAFGDGMMRNIWEELDTFKPVRECRQMSYLGAAHGWAGILFTTLNWCRVSGSAFPSEMEERLGQLAGLAERYGRIRRWKWNLRKGGTGEQAAYMAGWCNGSAGFVFLWTLAHRMLGRSEYAALAEGAAFDCWQSDSQIGNLCCGYAGQAYALLNIYKHTRQTSWLHKAQAVTQKAARAIREMPSVDAHQDLVLRGDSLYKGQVGVALLTAELEQPEFAAMPFFEIDE